MMVLEVGVVTSVAFIGLRLMFLSILVYSSVRGYQKSRIQTEYALNRYRVNSTLTNIAVLVYVIGVVMFKSVFTFYGSAASIGILLYVLGMLSIGFTLTVITTIIVNNMCRVFRRRHPEISSLHVYTHK